MKQMSLADGLIVLVSAEKKRRACEDAISKIAGQRVNVTVHMQDDTEHAELAQAGVFLGWRLNNYSRGGASVDSPYRPKCSSIGHCFVWFADPPKVAF